MRYLHALVWIGLLVLCQRAHAEVIGGFSLEWLADTCPYIGIYTCDHVAAMVGDSNHTVLVTGTCQTALRGSPPHKLIFDYPGVDPKEKHAPEETQKGDQFLVFLRDGWESEVMPEYIINMSHPHKRGPHHVALAHDFSLLLNNKEIEKVVRDRVATHPLTPLPWKEHDGNCCHLRVPWGSPAHGAIYGGSSCFLIVPKDLWTPSKPCDGP